MRFPARLADVFDHLNRIVETEKNNIFTASSPALSPAPFPAQCYLTNALTAGGNSNNESSIGS